MNDELDELKRDYRNINAPPHLATRVRAVVTERKARSTTWLTGAATAMVVAALVWVLPIPWQGSSVDTPAPARPTLSALAALKPSKPSGATPSFSQLQSVTIPRMPEKPKPSQPQSNIQIENLRFKENDHALT
ncbi:MAG: hypothetical protein ACE5F8_03765 [Woeseiaceae bacterium]